MRLEKNRLKLFMMAIILAAWFLCGFGYRGILPELGKSTKPKKQQQQETPSQPQEQEQSPTDEPELPAFPQAKIFFPRIYSGYSMNKYSNYLKDLKQVEPVLVSLKEVLQSDREDKFRFFSAKSNIIHLHVENMKSKYSNGAEKNYESYKQLVNLDKHLVEAAEYFREAQKYRKNFRGSLVNKIEDESYMRKKIDKSINSIDSVLEILQNTK